MRARADARELPFEDRKPVTAEDLRALLRRKFPADQFAMLYEVRDAAGLHANRSADVVMVGLWPSRGCQVEGMEVKVSRSDWLRELSRPEKVEAFFKFCDRWWVVAGHDDIVEEHELPKTWGLMVAGRRGLTIAKAAPRLKPRPVDRSFLAAMLKRACMTSLGSPEVRAAIQQGIESVRHAAESAARVDAAPAKYELESLQRHVKDFEEASGVSIKHWNAGRIGDAVRIVLDGNLDARRRNLYELKDRARRVFESLTEILPEEEGGHARPG